MTHATVPQTIPEFVDACRTLSSDAIYDVFESDIPQRLRDELYAMADPESPEPCRSAMIKLGHQHNVKSLIDF